MSYRLDMEAWDEDVGGSDQLIEKQTVQNWLQPSNQWKDIKAGFHFHGLIWPNLPLSKSISTLTFAKLWPEMTLNETHKSTMVKMHFSSTRSRSNVMRITMGSIVQKTANRETIFMVISLVTRTVNEFALTIGRGNIAMNQSAQKLVIQNMVIAKLLENAGMFWSISTSVVWPILYGCSTVLNWFIYYLWSALIPGNGNERD